MIKTNKEIAEHLIKNDPIMGEIIGDGYIVERDTYDDYFISLVETIISQQLSGKVAIIICERLKNLVNNSLNVDSLNNLSLEELRSIGLSTNKIKYLKDLCLKVKHKEIDLNKIDKLSDQEVINELTKIKGIGVWSAEMFLIFSLKREDVFAVNDGGLIRAVNKYYSKALKLKPDEILKIAENWRPYRTYASFYLWRSL